MVDYLDPRARVGINIEPYGLGVDLSSLVAPKVAFLANGFPDSVRFLSAVREELQKLLPNLQALELDKGNASVTVSDAMLQEIKGADAAVAAYGH